MTVLSFVPDLQVVVAETTCQAVRCASRTAEVWYHRVKAANDKYEGKILKDGHREQDARDYVLCAHAVRAVRKEHAKTDTILLRSLSGVEFLQGTVATLGGVRACLTPSPAIDLFQESDSSETTLAETPPPTHPNYPTHWTPSPLSASVSLRLRTNTAAAIIERAECEVIGMLDNCVVLACHRTHPPSIHEDAKEQGEPVVESIDVRAAINILGRFPTQEVGFFRTSPFHDPTQPSAASANVPEQVWLRATRSLARRAGVVMITGRALELTWKFFLSRAWSILTRLITHCCVCESSSCLDTDLNRLEDIVNGESTRICGDHIITTHSPVAPEREDMDEATLSDLEESADLGSEDGDDDGPEVGRDDDGVLWVSPSASRLEEDGGSIQVGRGNF